jgi:hypothetical protein
VLASTAELIIEQRRFSFFQHVCAVVPEYDTKGNHASGPRQLHDLGQLRESFGIYMLNTDKLLITLRSSSTSGPYGAPRVAIIGVFEPQAAVLQILHSSSARLEVVRWRISESCSRGSSPHDNLVVVWTKFQYLSATFTLTKIFITCSVVIMSVCANILHRITTVGDLCGVSIVILR